MDPSHSVTVRQSEIAPERRRPLSFLRKVALTTLKLAPCRENAELCLTLTNDAGIQRLNAHYRGQDKPTDVLSFRLEDEQESGFWLPEGMARPLGDVIVSLDTVENQAAASQNSVESELAWVICHGTLHLLGFDHQNDGQLQAMRERERTVLSALGIPRSWPELWSGARERLR
ncbi:MAG: rRNA maturation RNase YbeY [Candidatus Eremiobacteraeota bacterium]|nr:rRNA maturation RNase YbeY [Candidatus Eremiobacteraeota bacterium]MCW5866126.1 rRNA maturation RNase YbeY [Candidatus Eremiobacteraeota bacterium]